MTTRWLLATTAVMCVLGAAAVVYTNARADQAQEIPDPVISWAPLPVATLPPGPPAPPRPGDPGVLMCCGLVVPKRVHDVAPEYPAVAIEARIQGRVRLELLIDATGKVESARVVKGVSGLDEAALAAARAWVYESARDRGKAIRVVMTEAVDFVLPQTPVE